MSKLRLLVDANSEHGYNVLEITENGLSQHFKKTSVKMRDTKIRINQGIFGEDLKSHTVLNEEEIKNHVEVFNETRGLSGLKGSFKIVEESTRYNGVDYPVVRVVFDRGE